jgi:hypothetical protein
MGYAVGHEVRGSRFNVVDAECEVIEAPRTRITVPYQANDVRQQLKSDWHLPGDEIRRIVRNEPGRTSSSSW